MCLEKRRLSRYGKDAFFVIVIGFSWNLTYNIIYGSFGTLSEKGTIMKRCALSALILIILFILNACNSDSLQTDSSGATPSTKPSAEESVGPNMSISSVTFDSFETICEWSNAIVKAKYVGCEAFSSSTNIYEFEIKTDFIGNIDEDIVHVYENAFTSFSEGKNYFLFLCGFRHALYPHIIFTRTCPEFLLGEINAEDGTGYTFYNDYSLDVQNVQDFFKYIKTEIIKNGSYMTSPDYMTHESYEDAYGNADAVLLVTVTDVEANNKYTSFCHYKIDRVLKGVYTDDTLTKEEYDKILNSENSDKILDAASVGEETEYLPGSVVSLSTEVGDQIIFLYRYDPELERFDIYSGENFQFPIDSDGGKYILDTASK